MRNTISRFSEEIILTLAVTVVLTVLAASYSRVSRLLDKHTTPSVVFVVACLVVLVLLLFWYWEHRQKVEVERISCQPSVWSQLASITRLKRMTVSRNATWMLHYSGASWVLRDEEIIREALLQGRSFKILLVHPEHVGLCHKVLYELIGERSGTKESTDSDEVTVEELRDLYRKHVSDIRASVAVLRDMIRYVDSHRQIKGRLEIRLYEDTPFLRGNLNRLPGGKRCLSSYGSYFYKPTVRGQRTDSHWPEQQLESCELIGKTGVNAIRLREGDGALSDFLVDVFEQWFAYLWFYKSVDGREYINRDGGPAR